MNRVLSCFMSFTLTVFIVHATGCERATRQIERDQSRIESFARQSAHALRQSLEHLDAAVESSARSAETMVHLQQSATHQRSAIAHQERIIAAAGRTRARLPDVEDRVHPLVRLAQTWGSAALIVAVLGLLAYLGVGPFIRRSFQAIGLLIPRPVRRDATFDAKAVAIGSACPLDRERIAARRASDPAYDRAYARAARRMKHRR